jgi:SAM-dependent methyltransferase
MKINNFLILALAFLFAAQTTFAEPPKKPLDHAKDGGQRTGGGRAVAPQGKDNAPIAVSTNAFNVTRPLGYYANRLSEDFVKELQKLNGKSHWIDGGSGEGVAIEHYHQLGKNANASSYTGGEAKAALDAIGKTAPGDRAFVTGITYHMVRNVRPHYNNRLRHLVGRLMEDIPNKEIGRADLISDVYGVFAYTNRLDQAMAKYLTALKPNGSLYIHWGARMNETKITEKGKADVAVLDWLKSIPGIRVEEKGIAIRITKTGQPITIPTLAFVSETNQAPPVRVFRAAGGTIAVPNDPAVAGAGVDFTVRPVDTIPPTPANPLTEETIGHMNTMLGYPVVRPPER